MVTSTDERRFYHVLIRIVFVAVTAGSLIALFGKYYWVAELFTHFRLYYVLIQALLVLIFLHSGRRVLMVLTIFFAIPNAWVVAPYLTPLMVGQSATAGIGAGTGVSLVALNVNYRNGEYDRVATYLRERNPDIIVIAEFTPAWREHLEFLHESYPYRIGDARRDPWGLAVFSRLEFSQAELVDLARTNTVHARIVVMVDDTPLEIFAIHLFSPKSATMALDRNRQLDELADRIVNSEFRQVVVGDMNLTPFSPYFSQFLDRTGLQDARRVDGFHITWPASVLPLWIPIDHALDTAQRNVVQVDIGPDVGSDHFPLEVFVAERVADTSLPEVSPSAEFLTQPDLPAVN